MTGKALSDTDLLVVLLLSSIDLRPFTNSPSIAGSGESDNSMSLCLSTFSLAADSAPTSLSQ